MWLTGEYRHSIDAKGRLIVPARLREGLGDDVVLTAWLEDCIWMWSAQRFEEKGARPLSAERSGNKRKRAIARLIGSQAHSDRIDTQGRITVPQPLRESVGIQRDVMVVGALDHVEIWDPDKWQQEFSAIAAGREDLAQELDF